MHLHSVADLLLPSNLQNAPGGRTALSLLGKSHYLEFNTQQVSLFGFKGEKLPAWFKGYDWGGKIEYFQSSFLPGDIGMTEIKVKDYNIRISSPPRALMECLYLVPEKHELIECFELMEGLNNLSPAKVQALLEKCQSIKVNRLFLHLAEKAGHAWFQHLDVKNVNLGKGKRSIVKGGAYVDKYQITVPKELEKIGTSI